MTERDTAAARLPGYTVWRAWRDGMLRQGRDVAPERMEWATLPERDKMLDSWIEREAAEAALAEVEPVFSAVKALLEWGDNSFGDGIDDIIQLRAAYETWAAISSSRKP